MAITRLRVSNFRCIRELDLALPDFAAIIGPNGAGKSTLLGAFRALHALSRGELNQVIAELGGFGATMCWQATGRGIDLGTTVQSDGGQFSFNVALEPSGAAYFLANQGIEYESFANGAAPFEMPVLTEHKESPGATTFRSSPATKGTIMRSRNGVVWWATKEGVKQAATGQEGVLASPEGYDICPPLLRDLRRISSWRAVDLRLEEIRRPQPLDVARSLARNGENLVSVLHHLKSERHDLYLDLLETLRVALPQLKAIELPLAGKGFASLNWWLEGISRPFDVWQLSDGTLRLLWLTTLLYTVPDDGLVLLDEPELSLHPQWLQFLAGLLQRTSARTRLLVATHSDQLIRWLEPSELLVADLEDGVSRFRWGQDIDLKTWLPDYSLDQLWIMGELGGRR